MISRALTARLTNDAGVAALAGDRVYSGTGPPDAAYPLLLFQQVSAGVSEVRTMSGPVALFRTLQQIDVFARRRSEAEALAMACRAALDGFVNVVWGGLDIRAALFDDQFDGNFDPAPNMYRIIQQYRIVYAA